MQSAKSGAEQFMFRAGQLSEELNPLWHLEFKSYHGLRSVSDIPLVTIFGEKLFCDQMSPIELNATRNLIETLKPLMKDNNCFHLICMIMMLDTSNLFEKPSEVSMDISTHTNNGAIDYHNLKNCDAPFSSLKSRTHETAEPLLSHVKLHITKVDENKRVDTKTSFKASLSTNPTIEERFRNINTLQKHYIHLLQKYCSYSKDLEIRRFGSTDEDLKRTILCYKQLSHYVSIIHLIMHKSRKLMRQKSSSNKN